MRAQILDFRVRREARHLVREARAALAVKRGLKTKRGDELEPVAVAMEDALRTDDRAGVRRQLPQLDALVDELTHRPTKSSLREYIQSIGTAILIALALRAFVVEAYKIPSASMYPTLEINDHIFVNKFLYGVRIPWTLTKLFEHSPKRGDVIVFIYPCEPEHDFIKRVVATAGQTVETRCDVLYVDGVAVPDTFVDHETFRDYDENSEQWASTLTQVDRFRESVPGHAYHVYGNPSMSTDSSGPRNFPIDPSSVPSCGKVTTPPQVFGHIEADPKLDDKTCTKPGFHYVVPPDHVFAMGDNRDDSNDSRSWGSVPLDNIKGKALFIWLSYGQLDRNDWKRFIRFGRIGNFVE
ncbi:MAG TPA: signal peptidase I [Kofleriaceae bacterium]|jgi:signal peptidase I